MLKSLRGVLPAIITPFTSTYEIDEQALREVTQYLVKGGVHGIVACGSTGEFTLMSREEQMKVAEIIRAELKGDLSLIVGATATSTEESIKVAKNAREIGADAILVAPPFYYTNDEAELFEHYRQIASQGLPIVVYNIPMTTKVDLTPDFLCKMASEIDEVRYVKDSKGNLADVVNLFKCAPEKLTLILGADPMIYPYLLAGAKGWISAPANIIPQQCVQLYELTNEGKLDEAGALYNKLLPLFTFIYSPKFVQVAKAGAEMMGLRAGVPRRPLLPLSEDGRRTLRSILTQIGCIPL